MKNKLIYFFVIMIAFSCNDLPLGKDRNTIFPNTLSIYKSKGLITYNNLKNEAIIESIKTGEEIFSVELITSHPFVKPILIGDYFITISGTSISKTNFKKGVKIWEIELDGRINSINQFGEELLILNIDNLGICVIDFVAGKIRYSLNYQYEKCYQSDTSPYSIGIIDETLIIGGFNCSIANAYNVRTGEFLWTIENVNFTNLVSVTTNENGLALVGINHYYKNGEILVVNKEGTVLYETAINIETRAEPIVIENRFYYMTYFGENESASINEFNPETNLNKSIYTFNKAKDISGQQLLVHNKDIFVCSNNKVIKISVKTHKSEVLMECGNLLNGVYSHEGKLYIK